MTDPRVNPLTSYAQAEVIEAQAELAARIAERKAEQRRDAHDRTAAADEEAPDGEG